MTAFGFTLSSEEQSPRQLVALAGSAEAAGFDFLGISDHYHPWIENQGHSPFVWSVLGAVSAVTESIPIVVGVTCPIVRMHPAIVAHAAATTSLLLGDRFSLGLGTGEALNEHVLGDRWPVPEQRRAMLAEAVDIIRALFTGETVDHDGEFYVVENARLFDPPAADVPLVISGFGPRSAALAGEVGDGYIGTSPDTELLEAYAEHGGTGPRYAQLSVCWAEDAAMARKTVLERWPNEAIPGQLAQDLPTWTHFEQAAQLVREEDAVEHVPCGPDIIDELQTSAQKYLDAGYDHIYFHQIGDDQDGFIRFWQDELRPALTA